eukprot:GILI01009739.1.p1 GENE.GILI01009739.1~~GILI01009739.1.p1  ORF type:complete len:147 (+),score=48.26 GILI01009739.1:72-512(+)
MGLLSFIGSICISGIFVYAGLGKIMNPEHTTGGIKASKFYDLAVSNGIPLNQGDNVTHFAVAIGYLFVVGAILFVLNVARPLVALLLAIALGSITAFIHINLDNPAATTIDNQVHALKNIAIIGGLLMGAFGGNTIVKKTIKAKKE